MFDSALVIDMMLRVLLCCMQLDDRSGGGAGGAGAAAVATVGGIAAISGWHGPCGSRVAESVRSQCAMHALRSGDLDHTLWTSQQKWKSMHACKRTHTEDAMKKSCSIRCAYTNEQSA